MSAIDGQQAAPRVYIRRGVWPNIEMRAVLFVPTKIGLQTMLRYYEVSADQVPVQV